jgi:hypothetical protein
MGVMCLKGLTHSTDSTTCSNTSNKDVHFAVCIAPDLATGERYAYPDAPKWHRDGNGRTSGSKDRNSFPGYTYSYGKSEYREIITGEGGFVDEKPGMYENVVLLDN